MLERNELVIALQPLLKIIACQVRRNLPQSILLEDLLSAGQIGLIQAIDHFNPNADCSLKTYVSHRARGAMLDYLRGLDHISHQSRQMAREITKSEETLHAQGIEPTPEAVASIIGVPERRINEVKEISRRPTELQSLPNWTDWVADHRPSVLEDLLEEERFRIMREEMRQLPARMRSVIKLRSSGLRNREVAPILGVHESRVSQILTEAARRCQGKAA